MEGEQVFIISDEMLGGKYLVSVCVTDFTWCMVWESTDVPQEGVEVRGPPGILSSLLPCGSRD